MFKMEQTWVEGAEGFWYEDDLQLAAELGKTLLERNKDLEAQLRLSQQVQTEQASEIDLLTKQLDVLRNVNESRMRMYEEVDKTVTDLERSNETLKQEVKTEKEQIKQLNEINEGLEQKCELLQAKIDKLHEVKNPSKPDRRTWSVPSLTSWPDNAQLYDEVYAYKRASQEPEITHFKETIRNLREQLGIEKRKRNEMGREINGLLQENTNLENRIADLKEGQQRIGTLETELEAMEIKSIKVCAMCGQKFGTDNMAVFAIEHEDLAKIENGELLRLKNGGSAYGSRESLNTLGLETEDEAFPAPIISFDNNDVESLVTPSREEAPKMPGECCSGLSILSELEEQYSRLVKKYETLVEQKEKRSSMCLEPDEGGEPPVFAPPTTVRRVARPESLPVDTEVEVVRRRPKPHLDLRSPVNPAERHFDNGPPEYKKLFQEIFDTLRRSVVYEDEFGNITGLPRSSDSSPQTT